MMQMRTMASILERHPFVSDLNAAQMELIAGCASNEVFHAGDYLLRQGEDADSFYIIRHGRVAIETVVPGKGAVTLQTVADGEILGWSWLVPPYRWRFDGRAVDLTRVVALDGKCLRDKCEEDPALGYELMQRIALVMSQRLEASRLQLLDLYGEGD